MWRDQSYDFVKTYLGHNGAVGPLPTQESTDPHDVLDYLQDCNFSVYAAPRGEGVPKYVFQGQVVTLQKLISIANDHRENRHLPLFQPVPELPSAST
jgi:hypothetical protein